MVTNDTKLTDSTGREFQYGDMVRVENSYKGVCDGVYVVADFNGEEVILMQDYKAKGVKHGHYHYVNWPPTYELDEDMDAHYFNEKEQEYNIKNSTCTIDDDITPINVLAGMIRVYDRRMKKLQGMLKRGKTDAYFRSQVAERAKGLERMFRRAAFIQEKENDKEDYAKMK